MESTLAEAKQPSSTRGRGANAGVQGGMHWQLNTDRPLDQMPLHKGRLVDTESRVLKIETINMGPSGFGTKVSVWDDTRRGWHTFFAPVRPAVIELDNNTSRGHENHARIILPAGRAWLTKSTLRDIINVDKTSQNPAKQSQINEDADTAKNLLWASLHGIDDAAKLSAQDTDFDKAVPWAQNLLGYFNASITEREIKDTEAAQKDADADPVSVTLHPYERQLEPQWRNMAIRLHAHMPADLQAAYVRRNTAALMDLREGIIAGDRNTIAPGVIFEGFKDRAGKTQYGFAVFRDGRMLKSLKQYLERMAEANVAARGMQPGSADANAEAATLLFNEESKLKDLCYADDPNGEVLSIDKLSWDMPDTVPDEDIALAPAFVCLGKTGLEFVASQNDIQEHGKHGLMAMRAAVKELSIAGEAWQGEYEIKLQAMGAERRKRGNGGAATPASDTDIRKHLPGLADMIMAYNAGEHIDLGDTQELNNTSMKGWRVGVRTTKQGYAKGVLNFVFIPPTRNSLHKQEEIEKALQASVPENEEGYVFRKGEAVKLNSLASFLFKPGVAQIAKVVTSPKHTVGKSYEDVVDAAQRYFELPREDDQGVADLRSAYGFDARVRMTGVNTQDRLEMTAQDLLTNDQTPTGKKYLETAKEITDVFKQVFMRVQGTESAARVLMELGEIHLPDLKRTVLFGPGGELYEVKGTDPVTKKTNLESIPVRVFARDSLYYKVLDRLQRVAAGTSKENEHITLLGAFKLTPGEARAQAFRDWAEPLIQKIAKHQNSNITSGLQGLALYSNLSDILGGGFTHAGRGYTTTVQDTGAARAFAATGVYKTVPDDAGARDAAQDSYKYFTEYLRATYAQLAISEEQILKNPAFANEDLQHAARLSFSRQGAERLAALEELAPVWRNMEAGLGNMLDKDSGMRKVVLNQFELERQRDPHLRNSMLTKLTDMAVKALGNLYARFVTGLASTFNLFNPVNIVNSARSALLDTIVDAFGYAFSMFVTNFVNKHFKESPTGKKVATSVLDSLQVRVMRPTEMRLLGRLRGSSIDTHDNEHSAIKAGKLRATFQNVVPGYYRLSANDRDLASHVFSLPELGMRRKDRGEYNDPEFEVQYYVKNRDAFTAVSSGYNLEQIAGSRDTLRSWWMADGHKMLFPTSMEVYNPTLGKNVNVIDSSMITAARMADDPSRFVHIDGDTIRIGMKTTAFGIEPREVFGDKRELARKKKDFASGDDLDMRTENRELKQRQAAQARAERSARNPLGKASSMFGGPDVEDIAPGKTDNYAFGHDEYRTSRQGKPSDRL